MESSGSQRTGLLTAGGVLSIVAGVFLISSGVLVAVIVLGPTYRGGYFGGYIAEDMLLWFLPFLPYLPEAWWQFFNSDPFTLLAVIGGCAGVLGIIALAGGISALKRQSFGLSLAGAIFALPSIPLGVLAIIFIALGKGEFSTVRA